ncbi:hypothetical protein HZ326_12731 [Fusarium oxysporum f. sp. albedinis]|nr:hypothetical protein HZ326_12731 [Fusarium oxysporum f. sp. albedinis]
MVPQTIAIQQNYTTQSIASTQQATHGHSVYPITSLPLSVTTTLPPTDRIAFSEPLRPSLRHLNPNPPKPDRGAVLARLKPEHAV